MKKLSRLMLVIVAVLMCVITGCGGADNGGDNNTPTARIRLRSAAEQALNVGEQMTIVYSVSGSTSSVNFSSDDESVVTVSAYGEVVAVGVGQANITLALADNAEITAVVHYTVTKTFFMKDNGYRNGVLDISAQETGGTVFINDGQAQLLVNEEGENWYFKTHLDRTGYTESVGAWGVGSFLVNSAHPIGEVMYWYALRRHNDDTHARLHYGGWRYDASVSASREQLVSDEVIDISNGVDFTIYRVGIKHYALLEYTEGGVTKQIKHIYDVPLFEGQGTFPGVFGQNQKISVSAYESAGDTAQVMEKLASFQKAESISVNVIDNRLIKGESYVLTSTVQPSFTVDKSATYELVSDVDGVTLTENGVLTVAENAAAAEVTVRAIASSDTAVTTTQTYTIINKPSSTSELFDTGMVVGSGVSFSETSVTTGNSQVYIPLKARGENFYVTVGVNPTNTGNSAGKEFGLMGASNGYTRRSSVGIQYAMARNNNIVYSELNGGSATITNGAVGLLDGGANTMGLLKKGSDYYVFINGSLVKRYTAQYGGEAFPVIYSNVAATVENVTVTTDETEINEVLDSEIFFVGSFVTKTNNTYTFAKRDFGSANDANWPPVNDYANGIKLTKALNSNFEVTFTMSDVDPYIQGNGAIDGKILVYLKSESVTCSLQFVIKNYDGVRKCKFVANLNDATWTEYDLPTDIDILSGSTAVKIVRTDTEVQLYLNGTRVFEGESFMLNNNYWGTTTVATPGIGSFLCGVTIANPTINVL